MSVKAAVKQKMGLWWKGQINHVQVHDDAPDYAAKVGTLCWDVTNSNAYICTVAAGTWVKLNA